MTYTCHYPCSQIWFIHLHIQIYPPSYVVFCMLMSAPGIMTQEIEQVGATVGGKVGMYKEINRKWGLTYSLTHSCLPLSLLLASCRGRFLRGNFVNRPFLQLSCTKNAVIVCPGLAGLGEFFNNLPNDLMNSLRGSYSFFISSWKFFLIIFCCAVVLLLLFHYFVFGYFMINQGKGQR